MTEEIDFILDSTKESMVNALKHLTDLPTEILTFSDDMDGLRKVPENVPNKELLEENLHKPLTQVPDPFKKFKSSKYRQRGLEVGQIRDFAVVAYGRDFKSDVSVSEISFY